MADKTDDQRPPEPKYIMTEGFWEKAVLAGGVAACGMALLSVFWLGNGGAWSAEQKMNMIWRAMAIAAGLLTFATVVWRGLIATRQADQQRDQIAAQQAQLANVARQIEQTEENNMAALLQKGAELLATDNESAQVAAGIATLRSVAGSSQSKFAVPAMDLLADFIEKSSFKGHFGHDVRTAIQAVNDAFDATGIQSTREIVCSVSADQPMPDSEVVVGTWIAIRGVQRVTYVGGMALDVGLTKLMRENPMVYMRGVHVLNGAGLVLEGLQFDDCTFRNCVFRFVTTRLLRHNTFVECDFSGTEISGQQIPVDAKLRGRDNYHLPGDPPLWVRNDTPMTTLTDWSFVTQRDDDPFLEMPDNLPF